MHLLEVDQLEAGYGPIRALDGVSLAVDEGELVAIIGANGAGKTTLLMAVSGVVPARKGEVRFAGQPITGLAAHEIVRLGIGHAPEGRRRACRFYFHYELPKIGAWLDVVRHSDTTCADMPESAF